MKKTYIIPETVVVRLQMHGGLLIGSLSGGEVGAPELFDDTPALPEMPLIPGVTEFPDLPGIESDLPAL